MKKLFLISAVVATTTLIGFSCKKDNTTSGGGTTTTTTGSTTAAADGTPGGTYNGILYVVTATNGTLTIRTGAAAFLNTPVAFNPRVNITPTAIVNSVAMNGVRFKFDATTTQYSDSTYTLPNIPPATWVISGAGVIPSFTYSNTNPMPVYTGVTALPATVSKGQNLVIPITGLSGCDQVEVQFGDGSGHKTTVYVAGSATSATIVKDSLTQMVNGVNGSIDFTLIKYNAQTISGKSFMFGTVGSASKGSIAITN